MATELDFNSCWGGGKVLLLAKKDSWCDRAALLAKIAFGGHLTVFQGSAEQPFPLLPADDWFAVLSYRSPWIVPKSILERCDLAVNFHPGSRDYPGFGCYSFALYEHALEYGCVAHYMAEAVDSGPIIEERRFPIIPNESIETLKLRTYVEMQMLYQQQLFRIADGMPLRASGIRWSRPAFTRRDYLNLSTVTQAMSDEEARLRIRSTEYPGEGARAIIGGVEFRALLPQRPPIA